MERTAGGRAPEVLRGEADYRIANLRFGHSYGVPRGDWLWKFDDWMSEVPTVERLTPGGFVTELDWSGRLPYPKGIDVRDVCEFIMEGWRREK